MLQYKRGANVTCVLDFPSPLLVAFFEDKPSRPISDTVSQTEQNLPLVHIVPRAKKQ